MELLKNLELGEVEYKDDGNKAVLTFIDYKHGEVREVNFNKRVYDGKKYVDNTEKAEKIEKWCQDYFETDFEHLADCIGVKKDVYVYPNFNSLWETEIIEKFTKDDVGEMINTTIKEIDDNPTLNAILIKYDWNGGTYQSKMSYNKYIPSMKQYFKDPDKQEAQYEKFKDKFGVDIKDAQSIVGKNIIVEVKCSFGDAYWGDIKPFSKKKK